MGLSRSWFPWRVWLATAALAIIFFSFTLTSSVPVWIDESQIVEYGRVTLAGGQPVFGFHQRSDTGRPMYLYTPLGGIAQELAYRVTAPSNAGPRLVALLGQLAAFGWFLYYLRLRGIKTKWSAALGLALLFDPLCDIGWRGGRVDGWAFAFLFASLSAIRANRSRASAVLGGMAASAGLLCWPSFAMLLPLIVVELAALVRDARGWARAALFVTGGVLMTLLVLAPFQRQFRYGLADAALLTSIQSEGARHSEWGGRIQSFLASFALTPVVLVTGLAGLLRRRNLGIAAGFLLALLFTSDTMVYRLRVLCLLPYLYLGLASLFEDEAGGPAPALGRKAAAWAVALMLMVGAAFTVAGTTLSGLSDRAGKEPRALIEPMRAAIGAGPIRVFMEQQDLYFVGRALGWEQFNCFDGCWGPGVSSPVFRGVLAQTDFAVFRGPPDTATRSAIEALGFRFRTILLPKGGHQSILLGWSYGPRTYGPYYIYKR